MLFFSISILPSIFLFRNKISEGIFTLSDALGPSILGYRPKSMAGCGSLGCVPESVLKHPLEFIGESFYNLFAFWSPHSGPLKRGSWFHNISFLSALDKMNYDTISIIISIVLTIFLFLLAGFGCYIAISSKIQNYPFLILSLIYFISTDVAIFGDNRHRLIAMMVTVPLQIIGLDAFIKLGPFSTKYRRLK